MCTKRWGHLGCVKGGGPARTNTRQHMVTIGILSNHSTTDETFAINSSIWVIATLQQAYDPRVTYRPVRYQRALAKPAHYQRVCIETYQQSQQNTQPVFPRCTELPLGGCRSKSSNALYVKAHLPPPPPHTHTPELVLKLQYTICLLY